MMLQRMLVGLVEFSRRNALPSSSAGLVLAAFSGWYASGHLGVTTETDEMFAASLPWRQRAETFKRTSRSFKTCSSP